MCSLCEEEALYFAYMQQKAAESWAQQPAFAKTKPTFSADAIEEDTPAPPADGAVKSGSSENG